jgi:hypothetical protein
VLPVAPVYPVAPCGPAGPVGKVKQPASVSVANAAANCIKYFMMISFV